MRQILKSYLRPFVMAVALSLYASPSGWAVTLEGGPKVEPTATTATITWSTDVESGTKVNFGTEATALTHKVQGALAAAHTVTLTDLQPGTTYYFAVGSARSTLGTGSFTTSGSASGPTPSSPFWKKALAAVSGKTAAGPKPAATALPSAPATRSTWASIDSLPDHFHRHGGDFKAATPDDYAAQAWQFLQRAKQGSLPMKWDDSDDTLRVWDPKNHIFAAYNRAGRTRTFFKPGNPDYWQKQPGKSVQPAELPF